MNGNIPILLLPLRIENRFVENQLWIRVFPDAPFTQSHEPALSSQEKLDVQAFKESSAGEKEKSWQKLVTNYGVYRASYLVSLANSPTEFDKASKLVMPAEKTFLFNWLPDRLKFFVFVKDTSIPITISGKPINRSGITIDSEWLNSFDKAVEVGLGVKININANVTLIDKIIVAGLRDNAEEGAKELKALIDNHRYSKGVSLLPYGTPTNNFENERSGHSTKERYEAEESYAYAVKGEEYSNNLTSQGEILANALGLNKDDLKYVKNTSQVGSSILANFQKASWFSMGGQSLKMIFGDSISSDSHNNLWQHYSKYVTARGPLPSLKIGKQPYGVLPAISFKENSWLGLGPENEYLGKLYAVMLQLFAKWRSMTKEEGRIPRANPNGSDPHAAIYDILNMQEHSVDFQLRVRKYNKVSTSVPGVLGIAKNIPTPLPTLPLEMLLQLLEGMLSDRPDLLNSKNDINANRNKLSFLNTFLQQNAKKEYAYNLSFRDDGLKDNEYIVVNTDNGATVADDEISLQLTETTAGLSNFSKELEDLKKVIGSTKNATTRNTVLGNQLGTPSLFIDFWLRGYTGAAELFERVVYFQPTLSELSSYGSFKVKSPGGQLPNGVVVTDGSKTLTIPVPFQGTIAEWYVNEGEAIVVGQRLFLLRNDQRLKEVNRMFYSLGIELVKILNSLSSEESKEQQKRAMMEAVDLNSYRLDAWATSLATCQLDNIRSNPQSQFKNKIGLGAYGWLEGLAKDTESPVGIDLKDNSNKSDGGIIHCPASSQSFVATLFKNAFLTHRNEAEEAVPNPFTLNLTSDRVQKSSEFMEGIRQGQSIEALLGYRLERYLHEEGLDKYIYPLRKAFPLEVNILNRADVENDYGFEKMSVIDGLKIMKGGWETHVTEKAEEDKMIIGISQLEDILDGSADVLFFETGFQYMQGNYERAAAAMDAAVGKIEPPEPMSIQTKVPGVGINHKLLLIFDNPGIYKVDKPKAYLEPSLESWLSNYLGDMKNIGCKVALYEGAGIYEANAKVTPFMVVDFKADSLGLSYTDLMYLSEAPVSDGAGEIETRIWKAIQSTKAFENKNVTYKITAEAPVKCKPLSEALEWLRYANATISRSRFLKPEDLSVSGGNTLYDVKSLNELRSRLQALLNELETRKRDVAYLSLFDLQYAKQSLYSKEPLDDEKLYQALTNMKEKVAGHIKGFDKLVSRMPLNFHSSFEYLKKAAATLFGPTFVLLPPILASNEYSNALATYEPSRVIGSPAPNDAVTHIWGQDRVQLWVEQLAQVTKGASVFEEWQMATSVWATPLAKKAFEYKVLQTHVSEHPHWVGLSKSEIDELRKKLNHTPLKKAHYPRGSESLVLFAPTSIAFRGERDGKKNQPLPIYGLVVEEFSEHIPDSKMPTGLNFHYNGPNSEPPQSMLLAIKKQGLQDGALWTEEHLADIVIDTLDMAKIRLMDLESLKDLGFVLPMVDWFEIPPAN